MTEEKEGRSGRYLVIFFILSLMQRLALLAREQEALVLSFVSLDSPGR